VGEPVWQEGIGCLLLLTAAQQTGLLETIVSAIIEVTDPRLLGLRAKNPEAVARLVLTLLFLPVAGLARTWDLRSYTGTMLALVTDRERAYSQRHTERFLAHLAHAGGAQRLTEVMAKWTWLLWRPEEGSSVQPGARLIFYYVDGHRKAVYSDVLIPRGPVGKLGGKILGCRELVVLHDADGHLLLVTTHRGDYHLTIGLPEALHSYEQAIGQPLMLACVVVDREGMAAEFLAQLQQEGRQVVTLLRSDQYEGEGSFQQVGQWQPWRYDRHGKLICEVAAARFTLTRPDSTSPPLEVEVALIRDCRKLLVVEGSSQSSDTQDWQADLAHDQTHFWEQGWQAQPAPAAPTTAKLLPVITTGKGMDAVKLAQTYFKRWNCQENAIRDWLIPLNLDTNHGYTKELVVNSELTKRQGEVQGRVQRLQRLAQAARTRLSQRLKQQSRLQEQTRIHEQRRDELAAQVRALEETGQVQWRNYTRLKARRLTEEEKVRRGLDKLEKNAVQRQKEMDTCEKYCRELRQALRKQEDLQAQARNMYELDHSKDQIMSLLKLGLANLGTWVRDHYFGEGYQHCGWQRLLPFFKLGGQITTTADEVHLQFATFNNRALDRDLEEVCRKVNANRAILPDGRRLVLAVGERLRVPTLNMPLAQTA
jgi:hypothetical protein